jgi:hypothetical protein
MHKLTSGLVLACFVSFHPYLRVLPQHEDTLIGGDRVVFSPKLKSIQIDGTTTVYTSGALGGSIDADFLSLARNSAASLGTRLGVDRYIWGNFGGVEGDYLDYDALLRFSLSGQSVRFDLFGGTAYRINMEAPSSYWGWGPKFGVQFRWRILPGILGLLFKWNGHAGGVGLYGGWDQ